MELPIVLRRRFIVGKRAIGVCRRDRRERHAMKPCCRATEPGETFGRGHLGLLPLRRFASQPVQELRESGAIAEMRLLHSLDLDRILDRLGHPRRVGHVVNLRAALRSEEHTSALQSLLRISYAVFCLKKKKTDKLKKQRIN